MDIGQLFGILFPIVLAAVVIIIAWTLIKKMMGGFQPPRYGIRPMSVGERLKKYIVKASKSNPHNVKTICLRTTEYSSGGRIGRVVGVLPTKNCTRFLFKNRRLGWMKLMYCPTDMHTSLHSNQVTINAIGLDNAGGFYYPVPANRSAQNVFRIFKEALNIDLKRMQIVDMMQLEQEQLYSSIAGSSAQEEIVRTSPEEIRLQRVDNQQQGEGEEQNA